VERPRPALSSSDRAARRALEPAGGLHGDAEAAVRETGEEANARVELLGLYSIMNLPHISQVYFMYRARLLDADFSAGHESEDARLFEPGSIPWDDLAFPSGD
jgi:8-oxo-dGTP pyrophosphatase MutT (NUDIX family)